MNEKIFNETIDLQNEINMCLEIKGRFHPLSGYYKPRENKLREYLQTVLDERIKELSARKHKLYAKTELK